MGSSSEDTLDAPESLIPLETDADLDQKKKYLPVLETGLPPSLTLAADIGDSVILLRRGPRIGGNGEDPPSGWTGMGVGGGVGDHCIVRETP